MFKKILNFIKTDKDEVVDFGSEYELLVKNGRIIDCSNEQEKYNFDLKIGIYHDTYRYVTAGFNTDTQQINIERLFSLTSYAYQLMLKEISGSQSIQEFLDSIDSKEHKREQQLYEVDKIRLPGGKTTDIFCINLMIRPTETSFLVIGKRPKGRITRPERIKALKDSAYKWEDFKHL